MASPFFDGRVIFAALRTKAVVPPNIMLISDKMFALKAAPPFNQLRDSELALIAEVAREKRYEAGTIVCSQEKPLQRLHIVLEGGVLLASGATMPPVFGVAALLCDMPVTQTLTVAPEGAVCLLINKGNFFTTINECPNLVAGFLGIQLSEECIISS